MVSISVMRAASSHFQHSSQTEGHCNLVDGFDSKSRESVTPFLTRFPAVLTTLALVSLDFGDRTEHTLFWRAHQLVCTGQTFYRKTNANLCPYGP